MSCINLININIYVTGGGRGEVERSKIVTIDENGCIRKCFLTVFSGKNGVLVLRVMVLIW